MMMDIFGASLSLLTTYYFIRLNSKAWPCSLLAICLNGWLYWQKGIYGDMALESFYFFTTCYGWYLWFKPVKKNESLIKSLSVNQWLLILLIIGFLFLLIVNLLSRYTHSNIATLDALTTALSLVAQWLMCYRVISTWILWFITDTLYISMYLQKQLPAHALLMCVYTVMAIVGYWSWMKQRRQQKVLLPPSNLKYN